MALCPLDLHRDISGRSNYSFEDEDEQDDPYGFRPSGCATPVGDREGAARRAQVIYTSLEQLQQEEEKRIEETVDCTGLSTDEAFMFLRLHGWDTAAFEERFFENPEVTRHAAGVSDQEELAGEREEGLCNICFTSSGIPLMPCELRRVTDENGKGPKAHPLYCKECWQQYMEHAVNEGKSCLELRCPTPGCSEVVRPSMFSNLLAGNMDALNRYRRFQAESLVDDSRGRARWCPGPGCSYAASEPAVGTGQVECACGTIWCFGCGTDTHLPVSCEIVKRWERKNRDERENATWISVNTKPCPKCGNPIEKNGGCMHMTCRKPGGCGHEFCWICMGNWDGHTNCNAMTQSKKKLEAQALAKSELIRYGHFYERFCAHEKAQQFSARDQREWIREIGETMIRSNNFLEKDVHFLDVAVCEIRDCRRFLKWTYVFGYFSSFSERQRELFEFHQGQLEGTVDRLSDIMENTDWSSYFDEAAVSHKPFYDLRQKLVTLTDVVHQFFSNLREAIEQGTLA